MSLIEFVLSWVQTWEKKRGARVVLWWIQAGRRRGTGRSEAAAARPWRQLRLRSIPTAQ